MIFKYLSKREVLFFFFNFYKKIILFLRTFPNPLAFLSKLC